MRSDQQRIIIQLIRLIMLHDYSNNLPPERLSARRTGQQYTENRAPLSIHNIDMFDL